MRRRAFSVVLIAQTWMWCTALTPGTASIVFSTSSMRIPTERRRATDAGCRASATRPMPRSRRQRQARRRGLRSSIPSTRSRHPTPAPPHRHQRIGGHMQISPFHVQVFVLILLGKPGRKAVDHNPDAGRPGDGSAPRRVPDAASAPRSPATMTPTATSRITELSSEMSTVLFL